MELTLEARERIGLPACVANQHGRIVGWNQSATAFFRLSADAALGREWHGVVHTVRTSGCCALCSTRRSLRSGEPAVPVEATVSIDGYYEQVTMVPMPIGLGSDEAIGFLILKREFAGVSDPRASTPATRTRVRRLGGDRIIDELTPRERDILSCVVDGHDARSIAAQLGITHATARNYVQRILTKLGARNKAEAVSVALTYNLLAS